MASVRVLYTARAARAILADPGEGIERVLERVMELGDRHGRGFRYLPGPDIERRVHERIGVPWPCAEADAFAGVWSGLLASARARGLEVGRASYGNWDDGDARLARLVWCLVRHLHPERVVETGVARGFTTATVLTALARNGRGGLWSIDVPPLIESRLADETGVVVPDDVRGRWTLVRGSSRRRLSDVLRDLGSVDLFLHDSMHTTRNVRFELAAIWPHLAPGGVAVVDDVERNRGYGRFTRAHDDAGPLLGLAEDGRALIGCLFKDPR
jgi:predicted O-methyltransferase YrrM